MKEYQKRWFEKNREHWNAQVRVRGKIYDFGGNREAAIIRDGEKCVDCGMTREQHKRRWGRDITVDHIDGKGRYTPKVEKNHALENLKTLCLTCHGTKDAARREYKLTAEQATEIKSKYDPNNRKSKSNLATEYGVSYYTVWDIVKGRTRRST